MDELFVAIKGGGATLNGVPIAVSRVTDLIGGLLCTGFPYRLDGPTNNLVNWGISFSARRRPAVTAPPRWTSATSPPGGSTDSGN